jgi:hypothetical protein
MKSARCSNPRCPNEGKNVPCFRGGQNGAPICIECAYREEMAKAKKSEAKEATP